MKTTCEKKKKKQHWGNQPSTQSPCRTLIIPRCHLTVHTFQLQHLLYQASVTW